MSEEKNIKSFVDTSGRVLIGDFVREEDGHYVVKNPFMLHLQPQDNQQMGLQLFPVLFGVLVHPEDKPNGVEFKYPVNSIAVSDVKLNPVFIQDYEKVVEEQMALKPIPQPVAEEKADGPVLQKLFDNE